MSTHHAYNYCRADTHNSVRLVNQISNTSCSRGRNWGYDGRGIWVDDGCSATFEYGYGGGGHGNRHDNSGDIAAGVAAVVILAAIANSSSNHSHHDNNHDQGYGNVPEWAVGRFSGTDNVSGTPIDLSVQRSGNIDGYYGHQSLHGQWSGGQAWLGNRTYNASPMGNGIRLVSRDGQMTLNLYRD